MNIWLNPASAVYILALRRLLKGCRTLLDIGCGTASPARFIPAEKTGFDGYKPSLDIARKADTHEHFILGDVRDLSRHAASKAFDAVTALDLIEHLPKEDGLKLLDDMERIAGKRVVVFTPNGFMPQGRKEDGDLQEHVSGWNTGDFEARGYRVYGMHGLKSLRDGVTLKYRPRALWAVVSLITQLFYCLHHPETSGSLLAVKTMDAL
jgi:SAM-dependent methyltransferase